MKQIRSLSAKLTYRSIVICLLGAACALLGAAAVGAESPLRALWTTSDVVDERIAVDGQYALIRMCRRHDADATSLLTAILDHASISGIYQVNYVVPAQRARALGTWWWELIPQGEDGACVDGLGASGESAPMIVYRKDIGSIPHRVELAIKTAWGECRTKHSLAQMSAIPCTISQRAVPDLDACPEMYPVWTRTLRTCQDERGRDAAWEVCEAVCPDRLGLDAQVECAISAPECANYHKIDADCIDYADKQVSCPENPAGESASPSSQETAPGSRPGSGG